MTIYKKPDLKVFGANAKPTEIAEFEDLLRGWGITIEKTNGIPPMEWFNYLFNRLDGNINYILQNGITEYDTNLEYPQNAVVKSNGKLYLCLRQNTNKPLSNGAYWELLIKNATTSQGGIVQLSSSVTSSDETKASTPKATKTAYDKAVQADNNANKRVLKNGDTMTGRLRIKQGNGFSGIAMINDVDDELIFESNTAASDYWLGLKVNNKSGQRLNSILFPKKTGTLAIQQDVDKQISKLESDKYDKSGGFITGDVVVKSGDYSYLGFRNKNNDNFDVGIYPNSASRFGYFSSVKNGKRTDIEVPLKAGTMLVDKDFTQDFSNNGWCRLPNGFIIQWGWEDLTNSGGNVKNVYFPIKFNRLFNVQLTDVNGSDSEGVNMAVTNYSASYFRVYSRSKIGAMYYLAIGR